MVYEFITKETPALSQVGGKGLSLIRLTRKGFPVPPGIILPTGFFTPWIEELASGSQSLKEAKEKAIPGICGEIKKKGLNASFTISQKQAIKEVTAFLKKEEINLMAVRSSSPREDLTGAAFAGIYESQLGVTHEGLKDAIKTCFISVFDERVIAYKREHGFDPFDPKIAVIIQKQIPSDISGVAFSLNPVSNDYDEIVINANRGLGITVVDGTITPDQFIVNKVSDSIVEKRAGKKDVACYVKADGGMETKNTSTLSGLCLTDVQVLAIADLVDKVEKEYNRPVDIEWAYEGGQLYLLQSRPVTAYIQLPRHAITEPGKPKKLYQDGLLTEQGLVGNLSPLGEDIMYKMTVCLGGGGKTFFESGIIVMGGGRMYIDAGTMIKIMGKKNFIKTIRIVDALGAHILENLDLQMYTPKKLPRGLIWSVITMGLHNSKGFFRAIKAYKKPADYLEYFLAENKKLEDDIKQEFEKENSFEEFVNNGFLKAGYWMMNISLPTLYAAEMARSKIKKTFKKESREVQDQIIFLEQGFPNNVTIEMGLLLYELSRFTEVTESESADEFIERFQENNPSPGFLEKWHTFMDLYGHRYPRELDVASARYRERPGEIFRIIKDMTLGHRAEVNPRHIFEQGVKKREETFGILAELLEKKGKGKVKKFQKRYEVLSTFAAYREIHKYYLILVIDYIRQRVVALAEKWVDAGRLDSVEDVFQLKFEEVVQAEKDPRFELRHLAAANKTYYGSLQAGRPLSSLIDSRGRIPMLQRELVNENELQGTPVSFGVVTGPVKVLRRPDEKPIRPGDILVTVATDPGWTTLFLNAGGILLESGGILQHGASVARESGKPCVVGLEGITSILTDGQMVEVNGATGIVKILNE